VRYFRILGGSVVGETLKGEKIELERTKRHGGESSESEEGKLKESFWRGGSRYGSSVMKGAENNETQ